jgi:Dolichyl-phosphate-mannose-protein mannosyltransferase
VSLVIVAAGTAGVAATAVLLSSCLRLSGLVAFLLAVYLLATAEIVVLSLALSLGSWLTRAALLAAIAAMLVISVAVWSFAGRPHPPAPAGLRVAARTLLADRILVVLFGLVGLTYAYVLVVALTVPQSVVDTLVYHLPRAALWKQQHAVAYVASSPDEPINAHPPNAEIETMSSMILSGGDRYVAVVQLLAVSVTSIGIFGIARRLGFDRRAAAFGAALYPTFTVVVLQASTALNDLVVAALLVSAAFFVAGPATRIELGLFALALAVALGTKVSTLFAVPVLAVFAAASQPRRRWLSVAIAGAAGLASGSYWYVVNRVETGKLDGGLAAAFPQGGDGTVVGILDVLRRLGADLLEVSAGEGQGRFLRPFWIGLAAFAVVLVCAGIAWARGRRRAAAGLLALGGFALLAAPTIVVWSELGMRGIRRVGAGVGIGTGPTGPRLPHDFLESPMHSAYGLAFVLLLLGAGVLVVAGVARGTVSRAAVAAIAGVPLFLVLFALPFQYDPQRMRFFAFVAALAASTFGIALRVRVLAWSAVGLTSVTLLVLVGYFVPRPAGVALLAGNRDSDRSARWFVQGDSGHWSADPEAFRFLQDEVPLGSTLALAVVRDTYVYPAWNAGLRQHVVFVPEDGAIPADADWLAVGPRDGFDARSLPPPLLKTPKGWRIYRLRSAG